MMQIVEVVDVISKGNIASSSYWQRACEDVEEAILVTDWPHGSGKFSLNPGSRKHENGVGPMKVPCLLKLMDLGWKLEQLPKVLAGVAMGNLDALLDTDEGLIGFEWETGNISSSHRAINKIFHAMLKGGLLGGILAVPAQSMRQYLTDRIGNITELREYFPVWNAICVEEGMFRIYVVQHDELSEDVPIMGKLAGGFGELKNPPKEPKKAKKPKKRKPL